MDDSGFTPPSVPPSGPPPFQGPPPVPPVVPPFRPGAAPSGRPDPRRRRGGSGWIVAIVVVLVVGVLGVSCLALLGIRGFAKYSRIAAHGRHATHDSDSLEEVVIEDNGASDKIVVIDVDGVISGEGGEGGVSLPDLIRLQLDRAGRDDGVKAVLLKVDSPGGEVLASDEIYRTLAEFQASNNIPVITSMGSLAASGGYYISAASRWIVANELTITGSIGVIFHNYNYRGLMDKVGVLPQTVKSGKLKDMLSPDKRPEDQLPEERQILEDMINDSFKRFKQVVNEGRKKAAEANKKDKITDGHAIVANWEDFADGRILSGHAALDLGLVDELGNFQVAVKRAKALADIEDANLVTYEMPPAFSRLFRLLGRSESSVVKVNLPGMDFGASLAPGRLYFISPVHVH
jgi:protease IV